jgi:hypothetical protein
MVISKQGQNLSLAQLGAVRVFPALALSYATKQLGYSIWRGREPRCVQDGGVACRAAVSGGTASPCS